MVLVDSTVWIDWLRRQPSAATRLLDRLLDDGEALIALEILQEILQGAASPTALRTLRRRLGALYARCRWAGITPRSPHDCLIAQLAIENGVALLHDDRDFERIASPRSSRACISRAGNSTAAACKSVRPAASSSGLNRRHMRKGPVLQDRALDSSCCQRAFRYSSRTSTRRASAAGPGPVSTSGFFSSILSSGTPIDLSVSATLKARCLASSAFIAGSPVASW